MFSWSLKPCAKCATETAVTHHGRQHAVVEVVVVVVALQVRDFDVREPLDLMVVPEKKRPSKRGA